MNIKSVFLRSFVLVHMPGANVGWCESIAFRPNLHFHSLNIRDVHESKLQLEASGHWTLVNSDCHGKSHLEIYSSTIGAFPCYVPHCHPFDQCSAVLQTMIQGFWYRFGDAHQQFKFVFVGIRTAAGIRLKTLYDARVFLLCGSVAAPWASGLLILFIAIALRINVSDISAQLL